MASSYAVSMNLLVKNDSTRAYCTVLYCTRISSCEDDIPSTQTIVKGRSELGTCYCSLNMYSSVSRYRVMKSCCLLGFLESRTKRRKIVCLSARVATVTGTSSKSATVKLLLILIPLCFTSSFSGSGPCTVNFHSRANRARATPVDPAQCHA